MRNALLFLLVFVIINTFSQYPIYYAAQKTPNGFFHTGQASWFDPWDINVYVSTIKYGQQHGILLRNLYSTEPDKLSLYYPIYTMTGSLFPYADPFILYNLLAVISNFILLAIIFRIGLRVFAVSGIKNTIYSIALLFITALGRGISWMVAASVKPADLYMTSFTFRSAFQRPHEAIGTGLYLLGMLSFYLYLRLDKRKYWNYSLAANIVLVLFYPYYIIMFFFVNLLFIFFSSVKQKGKKIISLSINTSITGIITVLYFFHLYYSSFNSAISEIQPKLSLGMLLSGYGGFFVVLLIAVLTIRKKQQEKIYMLLWVIVGIAFSYLPFGFARFYLRGLFLPFTFLALFLFFEMRTLKKTLRYSIVLIFLILILPSTIYIFSTRIKETEKNNPWFYLPIEYKNSFDYLSNTRNDGILSSYIPGNLIPAYTGKKVFLGHTIQTPHFYEREKKVQDFYSGAMDSKAAYNFLRQNNIHYVYFSNFEYGIKNKFLTYSFLNAVYATDKVIIYELKNK